MSLKKLAAFCGFVVQSLGWIVPAVAVLAGTYVHDNDKLPWERRVALELALALLAAGTPLVAPKLAQYLYGSTLRDTVLKRVLEEFIQSVITVPAGKHVPYPQVRATVFVPEKRGGSERLSPRFRLTSEPGTSVLEFGHPNFRTTHTIARGEGLAGHTWNDGSEHYETCLAMFDYPGADHEKFDAWKKANLAKGTRPTNWSEYSHNVRSVWTFAIPRSGDDGRNPLAVFSVDSTLSGAFDDIPVQSTSSVFNGVTVRSSVIAGIVMAVVSGITPRQSLKQQLKLILRNNSQPPSPPTSTP